MSEPVSIIIPAFNQLDYCRQCIDSIHANTSPDRYRLILVNNGSDDGVGEYFDSIENAIVVHSPENKGFSGGVNLGLAEATGHVLLLNSDTLVPRNWLPRLLDALERNDTIGMAGPMSNYVSGPQMIPDLNLTTMDEIHTFSDRLYEEQRGRFVLTDRLVGFCMLIRDRAYAAVGPFDEAFAIGNYEDDDYGLRVQDAGFELCIAQDSFVFHYGSRTFAGMGIVDDEWTELLARNADRFSEKWKAKPRYDRSAERDAALSLNADARIALDKQQYKRAIQLLSDAIRTCPELPENYNDLGVVLWQLGEAQRSIALFRRALALNPSYQEAVENLANATTTTQDDRADTRDELTERPLL